MKLMCVYKCRRLEKALLYPPSILYCANRKWLLCLHIYTCSKDSMERERVTMFNPTSTSENLNGIHKLCLKREHTHTQYPGTGNSFCVKFANKIPQGRIHIQHFSLCCFFFVASQAFKMVKAYFANDFNTYISEWE